MKNLVYIGIIAVVLGSGCGKSYLSSLANNPNSPTDAAATVQLVLPGAISSLTDVVNGVGTYQSQAVWEGYWNYSGGYSFNQPVQEYVMTNSSPQVWDNYYYVLANINVIVQKGGASATLANYKDIGEILEAIAFKNLVDAYDAIPYTQALQGSANFHPGYDKGTDVYDSLVAKLDVAIADIEANLSNVNMVVPGSDDILFGGKMSNWAQFGNTVKLKLLVQQSAVSAKAAFINTEASKTQSVGYLSVDAIENPGYNSAKQGQFYANFGVSTSGGLNGTYNYIRAGGFALDFYKNNNDPRLGYFYSVKGTQPTDAGTAQYPNGHYYYPSSTPSDYYGDLLGLQVTAPANGSGIGPGLIKDKTGSQGEVLMLAAESYFVQAEATLRGYLPGGAGTAQTLYQNGITASFEYLGVPNAAAAAQTYYTPTVTETNVSWPTALADQISTVITQKWAALNGISCAEGWNDWRRTGFPAVPGTLSPTATHHNMPYRYYYPAEEPTENATAWTAAGGPNVDPFATKLFWMP
jgi:hypothetical protein